LLGASLELLGKTWACSTHRGTHRALAQHSQLHSQGTRTTLTGHSQGTRTTLTQGTHRALAQHSQGTRREPGSSGNDLGVQKVAHNHAHNNRRALAQHSQGGLPGLRGF